MPYFKSTAGESSANIYYQDCGEGDPVVLVHGYPLSHRMWEYQINALTDAGYRCIAYDRRGFGNSDKPWNNTYDYDTMTADLHELLEELDIKDATLAGFSMGGGEVARYFGMYGSDRISKAIFISAVPPYLLKTDDNPDGGLAEEDVEGMIQGVLGDRPAFFDGLGRNLVNYTDDDHTISPQLLQYNQTIANFASPKASADCINAFARTDFRDDLKKIDVPTLVVHGKADQIVPAEVSGIRTNELVDDCRLELFDDAPHGLNFTHTQKLNKLLIDFIGK